MVQTYGTKKADGHEESITISTVDAGTARATVLRQEDTTLGTVLSNTVLTSPGAAEKRHIGE